MGSQELGVHEIWMSRALEIARQALEAGEFPVGCVLVGHGEIVGAGSRSNSKGSAQNELDHAEMLALRQWVERGRPGGSQVVAYSTLEPCLMCTGALLISGIRKIVFAYEDVMGGACGIEFSKGLTAFSQRCLEPSLYCQVSPIVMGGVLRKESLGLFKTFFSRPHNSYLKGTLLERYTLAQREEDE